MIKKQAVVALLLWAVTTNAYAGSAKAVNGQVDTSPGPVKYSIALDEDGQPIVGQPIFIHGDQGDTNFGSAATIEDVDDARAYFGRYYKQPFAVIVRPRLTAPYQRTDQEVNALDETLSHMREEHEFFPRGIIAQSGAFPLAHVLAERRDDIHCLISSSGIGDHLTFFRVTNPHTSPVWSSRFVDPLEGVSILAEKGVIVGLVHDTRDSVVPIESIELYVDVTRQVNYKVALDFEAPGVGADKHNTIAAAGRMYDRLCR